MSIFRVALSRETSRICVTKVEFVGLCVIYSLTGPGEQFLCTYTCRVIFFMSRMLFAGIAYWDGALRIWGGISLDYKTRRGLGREKV